MRLFILASCLGSFPIPNAPEGKPAFEVDMEFEIERKLKSGRLKKELKQDTFKSLIRIEPCESQLFEVKQYNIADDNGKVATHTHIVKVADFSKKAKP
ncbi:MAG: hypothetical protein EOP06_20590 [Proteobacteria bacterium]|nr:MAG: hypothetical protein EOP06_20590 [Pseudomonadota bacterium]